MLSEALAVNILGMSPQLEHIAEEAARRLAAELGATKVYLFGSQAWGEPDGDSDVDLLVVLPGATKPTVNMHMRAHRCLRGLDFAKDILLRSEAVFKLNATLRSSIEAQVISRGKLLYG